MIVSRKVLALLTVIVMLAGMLPSTGFAAAPETWKQRSPIPTILDINKVIFHNGMFLAVGADGSILTSEDGENWDGYWPGGVSVNYNGIAYGNGTYVAVGQSGYVLTSPSGKAWTSQGRVSEHNLNDVVYTGEMFVAVGNSGTILTSEDGITWTAQTSGAWNHLHGISYGNGMLVAVGSSDWIHASEDGIHWNTVKDAYANLSKVTFGNGVFVIVGASGTIESSEDGIHWTRHVPPTSNWLYGVSFANGQFLATGADGAIVVSDDGTDWTARSSNVSTGLNSVAYGLGTYLLVGRLGTFLASEDGDVWTKRMSGTPNSLNDSAYGNGRFIAVGDSGTILSSVDGSFWTSSTVLQAGIPYPLNGIKYVNGRFVTVGHNGFILSSVNGTNWTEGTTDNVNSLQDVDYGNGIYVAVGFSGSILTSTDGDAWTTRSSGTGSHLYGIAFDGVSTFVVVGQNGTVLTSSDGTEWTNRTSASGTSAILMDIVYGNGTFVAAGGVGTTLISDDGASWTRVDPKYYDFINGLGYDDGIYVAAARNGTILASTNGVDWTLKTVGTVDVLHGVAANDGRFIVVGQNGRVYQSDPVLTFTVTFDAQEGSSVAPVSGVSAGSTIGAPTAPTRDGYTFEGWYTEESYTTEWDFGTDAVTGNMTLYAKWELIPPPPTYTVSFDSQGGSAVAPVTGVSTGSTIGAPTAPTQAGYTFEGWYTDDSYTTEWDFGTDTVTGNMTLYAKWELIPPPPTYTVSFDSQGGSAVAPVTGVSTGSTIGAPTAPTRAGYTFEGWYMDDSYTTEWDFGTDIVTGNMTLYAKWELIPPPPTYTVSFDSQGGSAVAPVTGVSAGSTIGTPTAPTRVGYTFEGWYTDDSYTAEWDFGTDTVTGNMTLYAKWELIPPLPTYTVSFDSQGGSVVAPVTGVSTGSTIGAPTAPTQAGYTFEGWYTDDSYTTEWDFGTDTVTGNMTLYAKWTATAGSGDGGWTYVPPTDPKAVSNTGVLMLAAGQPGEVSLDQNIKITIPANAYNQYSHITIEKVPDISDLIAGEEEPISPVYDIKEHSSQSINKPITLTLSFDSEIVTSDQKVSIFYYDESKQEWMDMGGVEEGGSLTAEVNRLGKYAVFAVKEESGAEVILSDIAGHWAEGNIAKAVRQGFVTGYPNNTFKPDETISRVEFAVMLIKAIKPLDEGSNLPFTDNDHIPEWARGAISQALATGIIAGFPDGSFRPDASISRAEMAVMVAKALNVFVEAQPSTGFADDKIIPAWAKGATEALRQLGIIQGTGANQFDPAAQVTRAQAVTALLNMLKQT